MLSYDVIEHGKPLQKSGAGHAETHGHRGAGAHHALGRVPLATCTSGTATSTGAAASASTSRSAAACRRSPGPRALRRGRGARARRAKGVEGRAEARRLSRGSAAASAPVCKAGQDNYCLQAALPRRVPRRRLFVARARAAPEVPVDATGIDESFAATLGCSGDHHLQRDQQASRRSDRADWVAVLGCGGLGLIALSILRRKGVKNVIACDVDERQARGGERSRARSGHARHARAAIASRRSSPRWRGQPRGRDRLRRHAGHRACSASARCGKGGRYVLCGLFGGELHHPAAADRAARDRHHRLLRRRPAGAARKWSRWRKGGS